jgi:hypothetical protein
VQLSLFPPRTLSGVPPLRIADEHFDHVIVQAIVKLALKRPGKLRMFDLARLEQELVSVHFDAGRLETNFHLDSVGGGLSVKIEERMLVAPQFPFYFFQKLIGRNWPRSSRS